MKTKLQAVQEADKLIQKLQNTIDKNPKKFCENYGQKDIRKFEDKLNLLDLHYIEHCDVMAKFECVSWMTPNERLRK